MMNRELLNSSTITVKQKPKLFLETNCVSMYSTLRSCKKTNTKRINRVTLKDTINNGANIKLEDAHPHRWMVN